MVRYDRHFVGITWWHNVIPIKGYKEVKIYHVIEILTESV